MSGFQTERKLIYKSDEGILFSVDEILNKNDAYPSNGCHLCNFSARLRLKRNISDEKLCIQYVYEDVLGLEYKGNPTTECINSRNGNPVMGIQMAWKSNSLIMSSFIRCNKNKIKII